MVNAVLIKSSDTVATATEPIMAGAAASFMENGEVKTVIVIHNIPIYHKFAVKDKAKGEYVYKYGEKIGYALKEIKVGDYVHTHNLGSVKA